MNGPRSSPSHALRRPGVPATLAILLIVAAAVVLVVSAGRLLAAVVTPGADAAGAAGTREREVENYAKAIDAHRAQFDGRSLLYVPGPPPPPPPPAPTVVENDDPPPPPPPPSEYRGPKLIGMVNGVAWFEDGMKLEPGQTKGEVRLVKLDPPWDAEVEWKGITFTVSLFARDTVINRKPGAAAPEPEPAEPPKAPEAEKPREEPKPVTPPPPPPAAPQPEEPPEGTPGAPPPTDPPAPENRP